ncbi:Protein DDI1-like protein 2-like [Oopsacas minuta]|uniref:Protein DDI1-like protein 2-like n=1 Tax=Oopsacas minuta TaxID=111878 RepID=A0AAV7JHY7_9METZ|nr:Protein DDI1-like protein 2-like [Oopsacas minuta]
MANNPPNPGDTNTQIIPVIDWGAIQIPTQVQAPAPLQTPTLVPAPVPTPAPGHLPAPVYTPAHVQTITTQNPSTIAPSIDWGSINIPGIPSPTQAPNPPPVQTQGASSIDWSSVVIPENALSSGSRNNRRFFDIRNAENSFPSFDQFLELISLDSTIINLLAPHVPGLEAVLESDDPDQRITMLRNIYNWIQMLSAEDRGDNPTGEGPDIMDPGIQERIAQSIKQENVAESRELAMEHAPEMFGRVEMLYIHCKVNSHPIVAFIDTGAQMSILSRKKAEECGIMRLLDDRYAGMARGVGTAPILGRIHMAQLEIENGFLPCSFSIMEQTADLILGLDMLKRHQCIVDLEKGRLVVTSAQIDTPFLSESEIPEAERMFSQGMDTEQEETAITESALESQMEEDKNIAEAMEKSHTPDYQMDPTIDPKDPPTFSSPSLPLTQTPHPLVAIKDTAEQFLEEEDKLNYSMLNDMSLSLPMVACPEKIIICMDPSMETAGHVLKSKEGSNQESLINICKNAVEMFICTKSAIDKRHQFGLITLLNSAAWTRDPSNAKDDVIRDLRHLDPIDVEDIFDLTTLFATVHQRVRLPPITDLRSPPPYIVRLLFIYCRSDCLPLFLNGRESHRELLENPYFFSDVVYIHKPTNPERNRCRAIGERLWNIDPRVRSYKLDVTQTMTLLYDAMAKLVGHPLQRPLQKNLIN